MQSLGLKVFRYGALVAHQVQVAALAGTHVNPEAHV
jgi:hypothetical protein